MKFNYKTSEMKIEELMKSDVLCASDGNPTTITKHDNQGLTSIDWTNLENFL